MKTIFNFKMKGLFILLSTIFISCSVTAQTNKNNYHEMEYSSWFKFINTTQPFYISNKPITNREYILYMVWTAMVYRDYSTVLMDALPGVNKNGLLYSDPKLIFLDSTYFNNYLEKAEPFVRNYLFNLNYLDYPVIGITWEQANNFIRWYSDRYNEYSLIKIKHLVLETDQIDSDHFSSEAFIFRQYTGKVNEVRDFKEYTSNNIHYYLDYNMRPAFHMATKKEIEATVGVEKLFSEFKDYYNKKTDFLKPFWDFYFELDDNSLKILPYLENYTWRTPVKLSKQEKLFFSHPQKANEWLLDSYLDSSKKNLCDILCCYGFKKVSYEDVIKRDLLAIRKDSLGNMPYVIIGEIDSIEILERNTPMYWKDISKENAFIYDNNAKSIARKDGDLFTTFRVSVNAVKKNKKE